jgi:tetratricopeptide (TPR) repeat protein
LYDVLVRTPIASTLTLLSLLSPARADEPPTSAAPSPATAVGSDNLDVDVARAHFRKGAELYDQQEYAKALAEFEAAFAAKPKAEFLYNLAQCHEHLGQREDAVRAYSAYLESNPPAEDAQRVRRRVAELNELLQAKNAAPAAPAVEVRRPRVVTWVLAIDAVALVAAGAVAEALAASRYADADRTCRPHCSDAVVSGISTAADAATVLFIGAGVATAAALIALLVEGRGAPERAPRLSAAARGLTVRF